MARLRSVTTGIALLGSAALAAVVLLTSGPVYTQGGAAPVHLVDPLPLPVTGSLSLAPGGTLTIGNLAANPVLVRDVDKSAREPIQFLGSENWNDDDGNRLVLVTVPADKRLVIEHASAHVRLGSQGGLRWVSIAWPGDLFKVNLSCNQMGTTPENETYFACSTPTKFYVEPDSEVQVLVVAAADGSGSFQVFISGYYEPVQ